MDTAPNAKLIEKINKLLRLARDGGATEGEADTALRMAQDIMEANNLSMATVEAAGGKTNEEGAREKAGMTKRAMYPYQRSLMATIAEINFCYVTVVSEMRGKAYRKVGYNIIGRKANVAATQVMFDYLMTTINRLVLEELNGDHTQRMSRYSLSFCEGMSDRLRSRLMQRHQDYLTNQKREANERKAAASHPAAATGSALVVVMEDFARAERELNEDFRWGWEPGTSARKRMEGEAFSAQRKAKINEWIAAGVPQDVASWMGYGYSREEAEKKCEPAYPAKPETEAQQRKRQEREERESEAYWRRVRRQAAKRDPLGYSKGRAVGDQVSLDQQIDKTKAAPAGTVRISK